MKKIFLLTLILYSTNSFAKTHKIIIGAMSYTPENLVVKVGDKVTWINKDISIHSATSTDYAFNSRSIRPKKSWTYTATALGEHPYKCLFHTGMKGKLVIE